MPPVQRQSMVYAVCWQYITPGKRGKSLRAALLWPQLPPHFVQPFADERL